MTNETTKLDKYEDHLHRYDLAGEVLNTLLRHDHVRVMSLNGGWGSGKTYFLEYMKRHAEKKNILFITHNVWENDYLDDPFLSIMAELLEKVDKNINSIDKKINSYVTFPSSIEKKESESAWKAFKDYFTKDAELKGEIGLGLPDGLPIKAGVTYTKQLIPKEQALEMYTLLKNQKQAFKDKLSNYINSLPTGQLIIAIDELDRTRPEYAIRTLEVIKHFFDIDGLKFILAVDKKQLQNTVKQMFGQAADTDCYLRKFVDLEYSLPAPNFELFVEVQLEEFKDVFLKNKTYVYFLPEAINDNMQALEIELWTPSQEQACREKIRTSIIGWLEYQPMALRDIEKLFIHLKIILHQIPKNHLIALTVLLDLLYMNKKHFNLFVEMQKAFKKSEEDFIDTSVEKHFPDIFLNPDYNVKHNVNGGLEIPSDNFQVPEKILYKDIPCRNFEKLRLMKKIISYTKGGSTLEDQIKRDGQALKNDSKEFKNSRERINKLLGPTLEQYFKAIQFATRFE
jgi:hypothetical protein